MTRNLSLVGSGPSSKVKAGSVARQDKSYYNKPLSYVLQLLMDQNVLCDFFAAGISQAIATGTIIDIGTDWVSVKAGDKKAFIPIPSIAMIQRSATTLSSAAERASNWFPDRCSGKELVQNLKKIGLSDSDFVLTLIKQYQDQNPTYLWAGAYRYLTPLGNVVVPTATVLPPKSTIDWHLKGVPSSVSATKQQKTSFYSVYNGECLAKFELIPTPFEVSGDFPISGRGIYVFVVITDGTLKTYPQYVMNLWARSGNSAISSPFSMMNYDAGHNPNTLDLTGPEICIWYFDNSESAKNHRGEPRARR